MTPNQTNPGQRAMSAGVWGLLLLLGAIWGGSFFFARIAVAEIHPLMLVLLRVAIAGAALHVYLLARGPAFRLALPRWQLFLALGLFNNVLPFSLAFVAQTVIGAGLASVLYATTPFWTIVIANATTRDEKLSWNKLAGVLFGIAGTAVMIGPGLVAGLGGPVWAKAALVAGAVCYALALMVARRLSDLPSLVVATGQLTASTVIMTPIVLAMGATSGLFTASGPIWAAVAGLALLSTALAYPLYFTIIARAGPTNASLVTLIVPVSAILLGAIFLGERLELFEMAGMVLIAIGLVTIDGRLLQKMRRRDATAS